MNSITSVQNDHRHNALDEVQRTVDQVRAAELLARQPLNSIPLITWFVTEDATLVGHPSPHNTPAEARQAFADWVEHLDLDPDPEQHRDGVTRLRAQGDVDGVRVTLWADYR